MNVANHNQEVGNAGAFDVTVISRTPCEPLRQDGDDQGVKTLVGIL
jgi:hypothetical protein